MVCNEMRNEIINAIKANVKAHRASAFPYGWRDFDFIGACRFNPKCGDTFTVYEVLVHHAKDRLRGGQDISIFEVWHDHEADTWDARYNGSGWHGWSDNTVSLEPNVGWGSFDQERAKEFCQYILSHRASGVA